MGMKENLIQVLLVSRRNDLASSNTKIKKIPCLKDASKKTHEQTAEQILCIYRAKM
jgi:hypothetical protein